MKIKSLMSFIIAIVLTFSSMTFALANVKTDENQTVKIVQTEKSQASAVAVSSDFPVYDVNYSANSSTNDDQAESVKVFNNQNVQTKTTDKSAENDYSPPNLYRTNFDCTTDTQTPDTAQRAFSEANKHRTVKLE